jgi:DNA uptake protein ComE-like DNA-binding protein
MFIITKLFAWLKRHIRNHFGFTKTETNGTLILLGLIFFFLITPYLLKWYYTCTEPPTNEADIALLDNMLIQLKSQQTNTNDLVNKQEDKSSRSSKYPHKKQEKRVTNTHIQPFDINNATNKVLEILPGIGTARSTRIIKYRDKLGGFIHQQQYQEIYGLDSLSIANMFQYTYITADFQPKRLDINQDDFKTLLAHPYLTYEQVKRIIQFREKQDKFNDIKELMSFNILEKDTFEKVKFYLTI